VHVSRGASASRTIVRLVSRGSDPSRHRFTLISEVELTNCAFVFVPTAVELTLTELREALAARGISGPEGDVLINDAIAASTG
jgi:hypothetical protein